MNDLISKYDVLEICKEQIWNGADDYYPISANKIAKKVKELPTVDAVPVRHGHWIVEWETEDTRMLRCSKCRMVFNVGKGRDGNYCPNCGCRMDEE